MLQSPAVGKARLEAFSDGVIAIIITIMVLELKLPLEPSWHALASLWPKLVSYVLSFFFIGDYWVNHHHMLHTLHRVDGKTVWLNLHLLFWISLIPLATAWLGETYPASTPTLAYGIVMVMSGFAFALVQRVIEAQQQEERLKVAHQRLRFKGYISVVLYVISLPLAATGYVRIAIALYFAVAIAWFLPVREFERAGGQGD